MYPTAGSAVLSTITSLKSAYTSQLKSSLSLLSLLFILILYENSEANQVRWEHVSIIEVIFRRLRAMISYFSCVHVCPGLGMHTYMFIGYLLFGL